MVAISAAARYLRAYKPEVDKPEAAKSEAPAPVTQQIDYMAECAALLDMTGFSMPASGSACRIFERCMVAAASHRNQCGWAGSG
jgi:hypothetical protein